MSIKFFCAYHSYLEDMEQLNDAERGRLFTACLIYSKTGKAPELRGNERFVFPSFRSKIDRDIENYTAKSEKQAANARKRWDAAASHGMRWHANGCQTCQEEKEEEKEEEENNIPPLPPNGGNPPEPKQPEVDLSGLSPHMQMKLGQWLVYKKERRENYKPTGLQVLVTRIRTSAEKYGEAAVCELIDNSMSSGYRGILFDRLQQRGAVPKVQKNTIPSWEAGSLEQEAIRRMLEQGG